MSSDANARVTNGTSSAESSRPWRRPLDGKSKAIIERTGPAVRAALLAYSSAEECARFETELRSALVQAKADLDLSRPLEVLAHWHALVTLDANPFTDDERELIARMSAGDYTGLRTQDEHGNWVRL